MPKTIRVIYVPVGGPPGPLEIEDSGAAIRHLVGGYFESHSMGWGISLVCNEDGVSLGLAENGCGILGPYVFMKSNELGVSLSLNDDECALVLAHIAAFRGVRHQGGPMESHSFESMDELSQFLERQRFNAAHRN